MDGCRRLWSFTPHLAVSAPPRVMPFDLEDWRVPNLRKPSFSTPLKSEMKLPFTQVPIALCKHKSDPSKIDKAFLPVIVPFAEQSGALWMQLIYVDVRAAMERVEGRRTIPVSSARMRH